MLTLLTAIIHALIALVLGASLLVSAFYDKETPLR